MNDHDCKNIKGHEVDDEIRIMRQKGDYIEAEVYCKHKCDYYATAHYKLDYNDLNWKEAY